MKKELRDAIANLVRHYQKLHIDHFHLLEMAMKAQKGMGPLPDSIIKELQMLRELPDSKQRIQETERMLAEIFRQADEDTLTKLLNGVLKKDEPSLN
jgi:hypothetical protein